MAILGTGGTNQDNRTLPDFLERNKVQLLGHPSFSAEPSHGLANTIERILAGEQELTLLCVEGSIINGPGGTGLFDTYEGKPKRDVIRGLCSQADFVFAMGTCAAFGGIPAAPPNPTESTGLQFCNERPGGLLGPTWRSRAGLPVLNLAGCPVDAVTMLNTLTRALHGVPLELDGFNRPATVTPCLSDSTQRKCGTAEKVGYACYGCISTRFPVSRPLFRPTLRLRSDGPAPWPGPHSINRRVHLSSGGGR
jgi:Ni,Fe-hydrogenase I small subunit